MNVEITCQFSYLVTLTTGEAVGGHYGYYTCLAGLSALPYQTVLVISIGLTLLPKIICCWQKKFM